MTKFMILFFAFFTAVLHAGTPVENIREQADICAQALVKKDFATVGTYTHPRLVREIGGMNKLIATMDKTFAQLEANGVRFLSARIGLPSKFADVQGQLVGFIPQSITLESSGSKILSDSYLLGISEDSGETWRFVDVSNMSQEQFEDFFPVISQEIALPKIPKPKLLK